MYRRIDDFLAAWARESASTLKVFEALTDEVLDRKIHPDVRTLGRLAWHITQTLPEMGGRTGLQLVGPGEHEPMPDSAAVLVERYREASRSVADAVGGQWRDADLEVTDDLYGERWARGQTLAALISHEVHHRGQMTVLLRQAGLKVPGVYGPSREEWSAYGMPAQE